MSALAPDYGPKPELAWLPVERLSVDESYQRTIDTRAGQTLIKRIVAEFRWAAFQAILVAPVKGGWRIIDGQHRTEAARQLGVDLVPSIVIDATEAADQAKAFLSANRDRVRVNDWALHYAQLRAGDETAMTVAGLCMAADITLPRSVILSANLKPGQTLALNFLRRLAKIPNRAFARLVVTTVADAYRAEPGGLAVATFSAVLVVLSEAAEPARQTIAEKLLTALRQSTAAAFTRAAAHYKARHGCTLAAAAEAILRERMTGRTAAARFASPELQRRAMGGR